MLFWCASDTKPEIQKFNLQVEKFRVPKHVFQQHACLQLEQDAKFDSDRASFILLAMHRKFALNMMFLHIWLLPLHLSLWQRLISAACSCAPPSKWCLFMIQSSIRSPNRHYAWSMWFSLSSCEHTKRLLELVLRLDLVGADMLAPIALVLRGSATVF